MPAIRRAPPEESSSAASPTAFSFSALAGPGAGAAVGASREEGNGEAAAAEAAVADLGAKEEEEAGEIKCGEISVVVPATGPAPGLRLPAVALGAGPHPTRRAGGGAGAASGGTKQGLFLSDLAATPGATVGCTCFPLFHCVVDGGFVP